MPVRIVKLSEAAKKSRIVVPRLEHVPEWQIMKEYIKFKEFAPNEAIELELSKEQIEEYRLKSRRHTARVVKKLISSLRLKYVVKIINNPEGGYYIRVQHLPVIRNIA